LSAEGRFSDDPAMTRALFVNSGMAGHRTFARTMQQVVERIPGLAAHHMDLGNDLTLFDRVVRRVLSLPLAPTQGVAANLDLRRWRQELNVGLLAARRITKLRDEFDLLHFYTQPAAYASVALMKRLPAIVCLDCTQNLASLETASRLSRASYRAGIAHDGRVFRAAAAIVATSDWAARDLCAAYPDCASKVSVLPVPVDVDVFPARWLGERSERSRGARYRPRVLFIGGDFPRKGGPALLDAWREGGFGDRADLEVVTDWPVRASDLSRGATVVSGVAAHTERWRECWRRADLFVMPTEREAFGIVYEEAGAAGLPAVGSAVNAVPEIIRDGETGLLVAPGNRAALIEALRTLIDSSILRERMGRAARQHVGQRAAVPVYAAKLGAIISSLIENDVRQPA
jgi:glycosyltransferase involved in cell wall biosynthesis